MRNWMLAAAAIASVTIGALSCDHSPTMPHLDQLALDVVSGDGQTAVVGTQLAPLIVKVTSGGNPVAQQVLNFRVVSGGGSVYGGAELTDNDGIAQELWTLGTNASQPQKVEVRAVESSSGAEKVFGTFSATALADKADSLFAAAGNNQTAVAGNAVAISPAVEVTDRYGNPISGVNVTFAVGPASGSGTGLSQQTNANGIATVGSWTLSATAGSNTLLATTPNLSLAPPGPVSFTALGVSGNAAQLVVQSGNNQSQSVCVGGPLPNKPTVQVADANGNAVPNVAVTFTITGGGGSIDGVGSVTTLTNPGTGSAAVNWVLGTASGPNTLQATAEGLSGSPFSFNATGTGDCWTTLASMPTDQSNMGVGVINDLLYAVGGVNNAGLTAEVQAYNPVSDAWATKASMPLHFGAGRGGLAAGVINGILYAVGSNVANSTYDPSVEAYDPITDSWTTKASMNTAHYCPGAGVINGLLYVVGGINSGGSVTSAVEAYDPATDQWTTKASMPTARNCLGSAVINGILYAVGGNAVPTTCGFVATVEAYDPRTDRWTTKASMSVARQGMGVVAINGVLYAVGGVNTACSPVATVEAYDPATNMWTPRASMPTVRGNLGAVAISGVLYAVGGNQGATALTTVEAYHP